MPPMEAVIAPTAQSLVHRSPVSCRGKTTHVTNVMNPVRRHARHPYTWRGFARLLAQTQTLTIYAWRSSLTSSPALMPRLLSPHELAPESGRENRNSLSIGRPADNCQLAASASPLLEDSILQWHIFSEIDRRTCNTTVWP